METIYYLSHKGIPFYIGKTKHPLRRRLIQHLADCRITDAPPSLKKQKIKAVKYKVQINEIESLSGSKNELLNIEQYWMWQFRAWGFPIINTEIHKKYPSNAHQNR